MHELGFDHPEYRNLIIQCDDYIGSLIKTLKQTGHYEDTAICISSDHGNYKAEKLYDLEPFFQKKGLIPYNPKTGIGDFDSNFAGVGFFNFHGDTWHHHPTIKQMKNFKTSGVGSPTLNLFKTLWEISGVKLMYYKDDNCVPDKGIIHLERQEEETGKVLKGRIEYYGKEGNQKTRYTYETKDLLGYEKYEESQVLLDNKEHIIDEWFSATLKTDFVGLIDQLPRYFKNPRSCDIMVSTRGEYCFNYEHGKTTGISPYSHDIASRASMLVPLIIGGSLEIPKMELSYCKTTDIVPTLLDLLGKKPHSSVIGKSVLLYK